MGSKSNEERLKKIEERVGLIKEPLNILSIRFVSAGRSCKACPEYEGFLSGLEKDASGVMIFIPICEGCQKKSKEVEQ